jgi:hypothetical protein
MSFKKAFYMKIKITIVSVIVALIVVAMFIHTYMQDSGASIVGRDG